MYFSQLLNVLDIDTSITICRNEYGSEEPLYDGNLKNLPFSKFREWHDLKVGKITIMPLKPIESAFLVIKIKGAKK